MHPTYSAAHQWNDEQRLTMVREQVQRCAKCQRRRIIPLVESRARRLAAHWWWVTTKRLGFIALAFIAGVAVRALLNGGDWRDLVASGAIAGLLVWIGVCVTTPAYPLR
jgi:hypothetical protein